MSVFLTFSCILECRFLILNLLMMTWMLLNLLTNLGEPVFLWQRYVKYCIDCTLCFNRCCKCWQVVTMVDKMIRLWQKLKKSFSNTCTMKAHYWQYDYHWPTRSYHNAEFCCKTNFLQFVIHLGSETKCHPKCHCHGNSLSSSFFHSKTKYPHFQPLEVGQRVLLGTDMVTIWSYPSPLDWLE